MFRFMLVVFLTFLSVNKADENQHNLKNKVTQESFPAKLYHRTIFIEKLFTKYGNGTVMTYEGFEHLMNGIEIGNIILDDSLDAHYGVNTTGFKSLHSVNHSHVVDTSQDDGTRHKRYAEQAQIEHEDNDSTESLLLKTCLSPVHILHLYDKGKDDIITKQDFLQICPVLIFQLDHRRCLEMDVLVRYRNFKTPDPMGTKAWAYGFIAFFIISISGLLVVASVPLLQRISFDGILQFLISLAVGALCGDAILHLLPHALESHSEDEHDDHSQKNVLKSLCGLAAMYFFFLIGRIQTIFAKNKRKVNNNKMDNIPEHKERLNTAGIEVADFEQEYEVHHHKHGHSHTHKVPTSVSGMVWRIIVGDGIHNFSDGLAIGVAFSNSITGGISTSIAILCHELPHEMGDFAVLLKKGVSFKRAVAFNCLSSALSCIGMVIGIAVGNIGEASYYIFVAIAGMFLYISFVDMIPELNALSDEEEHLWRRLVIQCFGLAIGTGIMLIIALYEEQIKNMLD